MVSIVAFQTTPYWKSRLALIDVSVGFLVDIGEHLRPEIQSKKRCLTEKVTRTKRGMLMMLMRTETYALY